MPRITFTQMNNSVQRQLGKNQVKLATLQEQLSSGKRLNRPSDGPIDVVNDMELRNNLAHRNQNLRNSENGNSYLSILDTTMIGMDDQCQRVRELALQGASDTLLARDRTYVNNEVHQVLLQFANMANASYKGDFLFSGTDTETAPFSVLRGTNTMNTIANEIPAGGSLPDPSDEAVVLGVPMNIFDRSIDDSTSTISNNGNPQVKRIIPGTLKLSDPALVEGTDYTVDYVKGTITYLTPAALTAATPVPGVTDGIELSFDWVRRNELQNAHGIVNREVERGTIMRVNVTADAVFGTELEMDAFSSIISLMQGLHTNSQSEIETSITHLDNSFKGILTQQATVGAWVNRMESTMDRNDLNIIETTRLQSELEDLDFAEAISQFTLAESIYNASLQSASRVLTPSLLDYM